MSDVRSPPPGLQALQVVIEAAIFVVLGPLIGGILFFVALGALNGTLHQLFDPDGMPFYLLFLYLAYRAAWQVALVCGVIVGFARGIGLRRPLIPIVAAGIGFAGAMGLMSAGWTEMQSPPVLLIGVAGALAGAACAAVAGTVVRA